MSAQFDSSAYFYAKPTTLSALGLSDHAIILYQFSKVTATPLSSRPISLGILKSPIFHDCFRCATYAVNWLTIPVPQRLPKLNAIVHSVAHDCREYLHKLYETYTWDLLQKLVSKDQDANCMHLQYLHIASRLVWSNNVSLARRILKKNFVISDMIRVSNEKVCLKDPNAYKGVRV